MSLAPTIDSASSQEARREPPARNSAHPRGGLSRLFFNTFIVIVGIVCMNVVIAVFLQED
jgi:hypothetical protein